MGGGLDKFYTKELAVSRLIGMLNLKSYDVIVEPSAGDGAFLRHLAGYKVEAMDISPDNPQIVERDFFNFKVDEFKRDEKILTIGNPPFGKNSSLAIKFFNHAARYSSCIAFIVPRTFRKSSLQNKLDPHFHLVREHILPRESFYLPSGEDYEVPTVAQVWERRSPEREKINLLTCHVDFDFLGAESFTASDVELKFTVSPSHYGAPNSDSYEMSVKEYQSVTAFRKRFPKLFSSHKITSVNKDLSWDPKPTFAFRRAGSRAGEIFTDYAKCPLEGFDFIRTKNENVIKIFDRMWKTRWDPSNSAKDTAKWDTAGQPSISKHELINFYTETKNEYNLENK